MRISVLGLRSDIRIELQAPVAYLTTLAIFLDTIDYMVHLNHFKTRMCSYPVSLKVLVLS